MTTTMRQLKALVYDEQRTVTAVTLARSANIMIEEATRAMNELYESDKGKNGLWAVFSLTGTMERRGVSCTATVLTRESEVEEKKSEFSSVDSVDIFSIQTIQIEDLYSIIAGDMLYNNQFFRTDCERAAIKTTKIEAFRQDVLQNHKEQAEVMEKILKEKPAAAVTAKPVAKKVVPEKKPDLQAMFKKACQKEKTPKSSPVKVRESPFSSVEKVKSEEDSNSPILNRKRTRKIVIDDEDTPESSPVKKEEPVETKKPKKVVEEKKVVKEVQKKKIEASDSDDEPPKPKKSDKKPKSKENSDIFASNVSTPEKEDEPVVKKSKKQEKPAKTEPKSKKSVKKIVEEDQDEEKEDKKILRRSPRKNTEESSSSSGKAHVMKKVVETYEDEDGFLVAKTVMRAVSVEKEDEPEVVKPLASKKENQPAAAAKESKKAPPKGQSKILSFFTKKT